MELILTTPIEELIPQMIGFNEDEIINGITDKIEYYKTAVYTEDTIKQAKEDKAALNKLIKGITDERIAIGKAYSAPYEIFKGKIDRIVTLVKGAVKNIDDQLVGYEIERRERRRAALKTHYEAQASDLVEVIAYARIEREQWLNASVSEKKAKSEIDEVIAGIRTDLQTISRLKDDDVDELRLYYYDTLSLAATLRENEARKERARKIAEMRAKREEEARLLAEERERAQRADLERQTAIESVSAEAVTPPAEFIPPEEVAPKLMTVRFEATGTVQQIKALKKFLAENNIKIRAI